MRTPELLDLLEGLFKASQHPEITEVLQFDNGTTHGVKVRFGNGAVGFLTAAEAPRHGGGR